MLCLHRLFTINSELFYVERYTRVDLRNGCVRVYGQHISLRKESILTTGQTSSVSFPICFFILRMLSLLWIFYVIRFALLALLGSGVGGGTRCNIVLGRSRTTVTVDISFYRRTISNAMSWSNPITLLGSLDNQLISLSSAFCEHEDATKSRSRRAKHDGLRCNSEYVARLIRCLLFTEYHQSFGFLEDGARFFQACGYACFFASVKSSWTLPESSGCQNSTSNGMYHERESHLWKGLANHPKHQIYENR